MIETSPYKAVRALLGDVEQGRRKPKALARALRVGGGAGDAAAWEAHMLWLLDLPRGLGASDAPWGALDEAVGAAVAAELADFAKSAKITRPADYASRWARLKEVLSRPAMAALAAQRPEAIRAFVDAANAKAAPGTPFVQDVLELCLAAALGEGFVSALRARIAGSAAGDIERRCAAVRSGASFGEPILICGFHHSGTRLLARMLAGAGVFQPTDMPSFEWSYVQSLDTLIEPGWMDPGRLRDPDRALDSALIDPDRLAFRLAAAGYDGSRPWGVKDPRLCLTGEAWLRVFPRLGIVHLLRDPRDVLGTLPARKYARYAPGEAAPQACIPHWSDLWRVYVDRARAAMTRAGRAIELRFEDLCRDPAGGLRLIARTMGFEPAPDALEGLSIDAGKIGEHRAWVDRGDLGPGAAAELGRLAKASGYAD